MDPITLRAATDDDLEAVCALVNRTEQYDGIPRALTIDELRESIERPYIDFTRDTRVAYRGDALAGWTYVWNPPVNAGDDRAYVFGEVDPQHRGHGVGRRLLGWGIERASERLRSHDNRLPKVIRVDAFDTTEASHRLYKRMGFEPVRWFRELVRPLTDLPAVPTHPDVDIVPWPGDRDDEIYEVRNTSFSDHWGTAPVTRADWQSAVRGHGSRPDLSAVAVDRASGAVVAFCLNKAYPEDDELTGRQEAWIETLGTLKEWRGRGVASALISWSLHAFVKAGFSHGMIGVDSDNPTGAARLYASLGFTTERQSITHQIDVG